MQKRTDSKITALYYRAAQRDMNPAHLDNQMQKLLCYAKSAFGACHLARGGEQT